MSVLVYIELHDGAPSEDSLALLSAAGGLSSEVTAVVATDDEATVALLAAADLILCHAGFGSYSPDQHLDLLAVAVEKTSPELVLTTNSYVGIDLTAGVATRLGWPCVTYCNDVARKGPGFSARCRAYGGKLDITVDVSAPAVVGVNPGAMKAATRNGAAVHETLALPDKPSRFRFVEAIDEASEGIDIRLAHTLVAVGRGIGEQDDIEIATSLAAALGGEVAGSRPIIDAGWLPKSRQVGKSGLKVTPRLYVALGISGAPEHLEGMSGAELILAINSDPDAPIFDVAHAGTTLDIEDLVPALIDRIEAGPA